MTPFKPYLIVNRLVILKSDKPVYDERFHVGVNIIRGKNSSGKSTIADFIFYALGGELTRLKYEAKTCDFTLIEVSLNGKVFTLKREIKENSRQGMDIYEGNIEDAQNSNIYEWLRYPYQATDNKESYYQALLKEMGIPYSKSDDNNSITMHQLLRLMYVDQMTSIDRLFRFDRFDSPSKRRAIGELLIGLSDFELYDLRVRFQKLDAMLDAKIKDIRILHEFFGSDLKSIGEINNEIDATRKLITTLEDDLIKSGRNNAESDTQQLKEHREDISSLRIELRELEDMKNSFIFDISDSQEFVKSLNYRLAAINDSSLVINALSDIGFHYCPSCFNKVNQSAKGCCLCGSDINEDLSSNDPTFKIRKEIEYQINESNHLIGIRQERLSKCELEISKAQTNLQTKLIAISLLEAPIKEVSQKSRKLLIDIGAANNEIAQLNEGKSKYSKLHNLYELRDQLQKEVNEIRDVIERKSANLEAELNKKKIVLSTLTLEIINADKDHEEIFRDGKKVDFDFGEDKVSIDERALFSASSMVYLKNAFRLALFEASCIDKSYIYPRFLLMDNVEDKGMQEDRSHIFQREIIRVSSKIKVPHQIIFTTSMIDPELNDSSFCVGPYYNDHNKTLQFMKTVDLLDLI